ncbi:MAG: glycerophosphodiester phosphodiesterase [Candidatus Heimdallarchaeota archaeon]|nr:glycerophosphodiester phosphodiesterase [Candidatus Heimdallarchaeota archaeon]
MWKRSPVPFLKGDKPLVMAHRGDSANVPENTLQAYQDAFDLKVDVIETDLRITKDDNIIFFHDRKVNRTTEGRGAVKSFTLKQIKKLDQGYNFKGIGELKDTYPFRERGFQIQSLEEILNLFPNMRFNMDIKDRDPRVPGVLAHKLKELDAEDRVMIGSFHDKQLQRFRLQSAAPTSAGPLEVWHFRQKIRKWIKDNPNVHYSIDACLEQEEVLGEPVPYFALQIPEKVFLLRIFQSPRFFEVAHMLGIAIHVWTVNDPGHMFRLLDWGVDGIFSDNPKLLQEIVEFRFRKK